MKDFDPSVFSQLLISHPESHKGQNGRLLIIGGSKLFHSASLWSLTVASRIVDLVHYSSLDENNAIVSKLREEFRNGIVVPRSEIEEYIHEDDCILIGPGMMRADDEKVRNYSTRFTTIQDILSIDDEGVLTYYLTKYLLQKYPEKKWVIDAGALQMMEPEWITPTMILTPHKREFETLTAKTQNAALKATMQALPISDQASLFSKEFGCTVLLKGQTDYVCSKEDCYSIKGGNAGMTKGGTGDVLAGLVAGIYCKHDALLAASTGSYLNKKAGEDLYQTMGYWFNASDLAFQIPLTFKKLLERL